MGKHELTDSEMEEILNEFGFKRKVKKDIFKEEDYTPIVSRADFVSLDHPYK